MGAGTWVWTVIGVVVVALLVVVNINQSKKQPCVHDAPEK